VDEGVVEGGIEVANAKGMLAFPKVGAELRLLGYVLLLFLNGSLKRKQTA